MEDPKTTYGRLLESVHISGYTRERAIGELKQLLLNDNWKNAGEFPKYSDFIDSLKLGEFKFSIDQRKDIIEEVKRIESDEDKITQRSLAGMLGVGVATINRDVSSGTNKEKAATDNEVITKKNIPSGTTVQKSWFEKDAEDIVKREQKIVHVSNNSGENEWYTPKEFVESARHVMGSIDLDPASSKLANKIIKANTFFTIEIDGLKQKWFGNIWLNPPYSQPLISQFSDAVVQKRSEYNSAIILVNNATDTQWLHQMMDICDAVCFIRGRVKFIDKNGNPLGAPLQGQCILYIGDNDYNFFMEFQKYGICLMRIGGK